MNFKIICFVVLFLFVLSGFLPVSLLRSWQAAERQAGFPVKTVYGNVSDTGLSSEERTSIRNFAEQAKKSIEETNTLIRNKQFDKAEIELENVLNLVNEKISIYENKAQTLVSEDKKNSAKFYYQEASSLGKIAVEISKSLKEIAILQEKHENRKPKEESANYVTQGFEYLKSGNLEEAETSFNKAIDILPDNRRAKDGLVRVERERSRIKTNRISELLEEARNNIRVEAFDEAEKELKEVLTLESDNRKAKGYLEDVAELRREKEYKDLLSSVDQKIEEGENNLSIGNFEEAEVSLNEALRVLPPEEKKRMKKIESLLATIPELKQKYQAATNYERIESAVAVARQKIEENKLAELIKQGKDYLTDNSFKEAEIKFLEALKIRPENELVLQYLAQTKQAQKDYASKKVIEGLIAEGEKYLKLEQLDKADAVFRKALKMSPSQDKQIKIQSLLDDVDKAKQTIYNRKLQEKADECIANGVEELKNNQYAKAKANFEKALAIKPNYSEAEKWLIRLEKSQKEANQYKLQTMMTEGKEYLKDNKFDLARTEFEEILKIDPTYPEALYYLGMIEKARDEYKDKQEFEKIKVVIDNGIRYLKERQFSKAESVLKEAVEMASPQMKEQTVKMIEERVNSFIHEGESQKIADKYIADGIVYLNNNEFDKAEEAFNAALNIIPGYAKGEEYLQKLEIAKLKYQSSQYLAHINSTTGEIGKLEKKDQLENNVNQLIEQIKSKIEESEKILEREN